MYIEDKFRELGITLPTNRSGQLTTKCPNCLKLGKTHHNARCLSVNTELGLYNCHKCGWSGKVKETTFMSEINKKYSLPQEDNHIAITDNARAFLHSRCITDEVIANNGLKSSVDGKMIIFPYKRDGKLVNYKTRGVDGKFFLQAKDAEPIIYNYDGVANKTPIVVCEGELDSLSWEVAGITTHTSVNMGAPNVGDKNINKKLECIDNCYEVFQDAKLVYIATDNDDNGRYLQKELLRRIGVEKCKLVDFSPYKDANEVLVHEGVESLLHRLKMADTPKVEGIFTMDEVEADILDGFRNGQDMGTTTYIPQVDAAWTWRNGELNVWTGYQNEGKSLFLNQLAVVKAAKENYKFAIFSPENMPMTDFYNDIIEMYIGKSVNPRFSHQMTEAELWEGMAFAKKHFFLIYPSKHFLLDTIFDRAKYLVRSRGINSLIIDPYNTVHHKMLSGEREDLYISRFMSQLKRFALDNNISVHLVAHQTTPRKDDSGRYPKPDVNYVKGGSEFANKCDNLMFVWRPERAIDHSSKSVIFGSQKIKKQKLVGHPQDVGSIEFNRKDQRYYFNGRTPFTEIDEEREKNRVNVTALHTESSEKKKVANDE